MSIDHKPSLSLLGVAVSLTSSQLSVSEGNNGTTPLDLCVHLTDIQGGLDRDVALSLSTTTSSAGESYTACNSTYSELYMLAIVCQLYCTHTIVCTYPLFTI